MLKIALSAVLVFSLVSCGSKSNPEDQKTIIENTMDLNSGNEDHSDNPSEQELAALDYSIDPVLAASSEGQGTDIFDVVNTTAPIAGMAAGCADSVKIIVNKAKQRLSVFLNCSESASYVWPVSTGVKGHGTPNFNTRPSGRYGSRSNQSSKYPGGCTINGKWWGNMPYAVYFAANGNYAIHGTCAEGKLGAPASHGCIRVSRANAITLQGIVKEAGKSRTRIIVN